MKEEKSTRAEALAREIRAMKPAEKKAKLAVIEESDKDLFEDVSYLLMSRAERIICKMKEILAIKPKIRAAKRGLSACKPSRMEKRSACLSAKADAAEKAAAAAKAAVENAADEKAAAEKAIEAAKAAADKAAADKAIEAAKAAEATKAAAEAVAAAAAEKAELYKRRAVAAQHRDTAMYKERLDALRAARSKLVDEVQHLISETSGYRRSERREIRRLSKMAGIYFW